jgi:regulator of replication initiation timing
MILFLTTLEVQRMDARTNPGIQTIVTIFKDIEDLAQKNDKLVKKNDELITENEELKKLSQNSMSIMIR